MFLTFKNNINFLNLSLKLTNFSRRNFFKCKVLLVFLPPALKKVSPFF